MNATFNLVLEQLGSWLFDQYRDTLLEYNGDPSYYPTWAQCKATMVDVIGEYLTNMDIPSDWDDLDWSDQVGILDDVIDVMHTNRAEAAQAEAC
jgi:hypothetical protein